MISTRRNRLAARRTLAAAGVGAALLFAGQAPALAGPGEFPLPDLDVAIPTHDPGDGPTDEPTEPTEPAGPGDGPGSIGTCVDHFDDGIDTCDEGGDPTPEPTPEPVDPCEPTEPGDRVIDDLTAVVPMTDGGEFHITTEVAECTPSTGGGGGAPFTG
ncbi:MAG: hypothetical protein ACFCVG_06335 [Kineosporiaceae bacterium]